MPVLIFCYIILVHCLPVQHGWIPGVNTIFLQINAIGVLQFTSPVNGIFRMQLKSCYSIVVVVVALLFYVHGKHLRSCRDGQLA